MVTRLSVEQVNSWRLARHHLFQRSAKKDLAKVVSDVCGIQAQVLTSAELALRARVEEVEQADIRNALWKSRSILKTWCMRGTLHLLASRELPLYVSALKSKLARNEDWLRKVAKVSPDEVASISGAIDEALSKGSLTREELSREVERRTSLKPRTRKVLMSAWGTLLAPAAYQGHLAFGENVGPKVTFVNPAQWVSPWKEPSQQEAMLQLFRRFLKTYGPATIRDFAHWWGILGAEEKLALGSISEELETVDAEGVKGSMLKRDAEEASGLGATKGVWLLPSFDSYVMHYSPRERLIASGDRNRIFSQEAGWVFPSILIDGRSAGRWTLKKRPRRVEIIIEPFRTLTSTEKRGIEAEAADVGRFLGAPSDVRYQAGQR